MNLKTGQKGIQEDVERGKGRGNIKNKINPLKGCGRGWRDGLAIKNTDCFSRGSG